MRDHHALAPMFLKLLREPLPAQLMLCDRVGRSPIPAIASDQAMIVHGLLGPLHGSFHSRRAEQLTICPQRGAEESDPVASVCAR